jgi:hypothetical protein
MLEEWHLPWPTLREAGAGLLGSSKVFRLQLIDPDENDPLVLEH